MTDPTSEFFDTGLAKIRQELKSRLVTHGMYGTVATRDVGSPPSELNIDVTVKGKVASRTFERQQIAGCHLRVNGPVLAGIIAMVDELAA
jgi:hypothetical protein